MDHRNDEPVLPAGCVAVPAGDDCLVLAFATALSIEANRAASSAGARLTAAWHAGELPGVTDIVPGMVTVGLHYRPVDVLPASGGSPYGRLLRLVAGLLARQDAYPAQPGQRIDIPVCYGGTHGPDLDLVAARCGLSADEVVARHTDDWLDVLMLGFTPGHPYIGLLDAALNLGRRDTPRTVVPRGSVGVANRQSVIYPLDGPSGWSLIGRTPLRLFNAAKPSPVLLRAGDQVRFVSIDAAAFAQLAKEQ